jgi:hypothetical protein
MVYYNLISINKIGQFYGSPRFPMLSSLLNPDKIPYPPSQPPKSSWELLVISQGSLDLLSCSSWQFPLAISPSLTNRRPCSPVSHPKPNPQGSLSKAVGTDLTKGWRVTWDFVEEKREGDSRTSACNHYKSCCLLDLCRPSLKLHIRESSPIFAPHQVSTPLFPVTPSRLTGEPRDLQHNTYVSPRK